MKTSVLHKQIGDEPFTTDPSESFTMPARYYTDDSIYEAEKEAIFYNNWWYAGHVSQVAEAGQYLQPRFMNKVCLLSVTKTGNCMPTIMCASTAGMNY